MMRRAAVMVFLIVWWQPARSRSACEGGYYRELDCEPVTREDDTCPQYYKCRDPHPDPTKCFYKGVAYADGDMIPDSAVKNPCSVACYCDVRNVTRAADNADVSSDESAPGNAGVAPGNLTEATFKCAAVDCVEAFSSETEGEECVATYELDSCCQSGTVCGGDAIAKLATCEVDGRTYREGQQFFPAGSCQTCICTAEFNGTLEGASYCRDIDCGIEIHYQMELAARCAPVLTGDASCCPHKWECPDNSTKVIRSSESSREAAGAAGTVGAEPPTCRFGAETLRIGDEVTVKDACVKCSCRMPPLLTCIQKADCRD